MYGLLEIFAHYNLWANARILSACEAIGEREYQKHRASFFGSISNTLNHVLVVDINWLNRIDGCDEIVGRPNSILYRDLESLVVARKLADKKFISLIDRLSEQDYRRELDYRFDNMNPDIPFYVVSGVKATMPLHAILLTLFNHHTHHRGQIHNMLSEVGMTPPNIDIIGYYTKQPERAASMGLGD
jgi:uncharacterized damage-inducible protein DinB